MIVADENIPEFIIKSLRDAEIEVLAIIESAREITQVLINLIKTKSLIRPFFATITTQKIRVRQL